MDKKDNMNQAVIPTITKEQAPYFTDQELEAVNVHITQNGPTISPSVAANFLSLYLEGRSLEQICREFPQWPRGAILLAAHTYGWQHHKEKYIEDLMMQLRDRLVKSKLDVVNHLMDVLAVSHKEFAREMATYLQNPKPENLPKNRIKSHREYKDVLSTLQAALQLGQAEKGKGGEGQIPVFVNIKANDGSVIQITSGEHSDVLRQLVGKKDES